MHCESVIQSHRTIKDKANGLDDRKDSKFIVGGFPQWTAFEIKDIRSKKDYRIQMLDDVSFTTSLRNYFIIISNRFSNFC